MLLSYSSVCYTRLYLLNIPSCRCFILSEFVPVPFYIPLSVYFDDKIYMVVITTPQSLTYIAIVNKILLTHVDKGNNVALNLKTLCRLSQYSVEMSTVYAHG